VADTIGPTRTDIGRLWIGIIHLQANGGPFCHCVDNLARSSDGTDVYATHSWNTAISF